MKTVDSIRPCMAAPCGHVTEKCRTRESMARTLRAGVRGMPDAPETRIPLQAKGSSAGSIRHPSDGLIPD